VNEVQLPEPTSEPENMILGETLSNSISDVTLYFPAQDGASFSTVTRGLLTEAGQSLPEAAVLALLSSNVQRGIRAVGDTQVLSCEYACSTATINLSIDARNVQNAQELYALEASIGNTLLGIKGIRGVNVLIGSISESFCALPTGVQTEPITSVTASLAQFQTEQDRLAQDQVTEPVRRWATLYFPTNSGKWLIPELREVSSLSGNFVTALIEALKEGPRQGGCAAPSIPEGVDLLQEDPSIQTLASGERMLDLNFTSALANYLAFSGLEVWELSGSLVLTMCSFLPELDAVRIMVNGDPITMCTLGEDILSFPGGLMRRSDFTRRIGSTATLYLVNREGALEPVRQAVSMRRAFSPRSLLAELFEYNTPRDDGLQFPLPEEVYPEDLLGVQVSGGIARVNLSANFYRSCQSLDPRFERSLVYAMVNTLCQLEGVRGVRFYVEGCAADTLAGGIYLKSILLPNPGIVTSGTS
ncbi:MAG: GerMN domain-containing protein, partial [Clostridia bacterium]|nr:GerMN domain-containing protein [Clostridia bacterium]